MTNTMRACALTLLVMARDARAFVAAVHFVVAVQQGPCAPVIGFSSIRVCGAMCLHAGRGVGVETCMLVDSMLPSIALHARWGSMQRPDLKARFRILKNRRPAS